MRDNPWRANKPLIGKTYYFYGRVQVFLHLIFDSAVKLIKKLPGSVVHLSLDETPG